MPGAPTHVAAAGVLQDPASLPGALLDKPGLLDQLSASDLGASIASNADRLSGTHFSGILPGSRQDQAGQGAGTDPGRIATPIASAASCKYADEGLDFVSDLTGIDFSKAGSLVRALAGGLEFLKKLKEDRRAKRPAAAGCRDFDPLAAVRPLFGKSP